jgi:hypothetical protein
MKNLPFHAIHLCTLLQKILQIKEASQTSTGNTTQRDFAFQSMFYVISSQEKPWIKNGYL